MAERKWKKISTWMAAWVMAVVFAVSGAQTAFAAISYVNSVSITPEVLQRRVMEQAEWKILPKAIDMIANGEI